MMNTEAQATEILNHLKAGLSISPLEALGKFGCLRLSARIYDLRKLGHTIHMERETDFETGKNWGRYSYIKKGEENEN